MWIIYLANGIAGYYLVWALTARMMYRNYYQFDKDRRKEASFLGFIWPVTLIGCLVTGILKGPMWAVTTPSLTERQEKKRAAKREKLRDLNRQITDAEGYLKAATEHMRKAKEGNDV